MKKIMFSLSFLASLATTSRCWSQAPGIPGIPAPPVAAPVAAAPAAPTANLWSFLFPTPGQKSACRTCLCNSMLGQLCTAASAPMSVMTGGLMVNCCTQNALANALNPAMTPPDSPAGVAARIQKDEADAKARRLAVRYLGTVDCNYWPDAIETLRKALRVDPNECVRFEAALALQSGCCCDIKIIEALKVSVMGSKIDGFPAEHSERVRWAASIALSHCVVVTPLEPVPVPPDQIKEKKTQGPVNPNDYYRTVAMKSREDVVASAREVLNKAQDPAKPGASAVPPLTNPQRISGLAGIVGNAFGRVPSAQVVSTATLGEPATSPSNAVAASPRQPFFSGLTRTLTGRQDGYGPGRFETVSASEPAVTIPSPPVPVMNASYPR